MPLLQLPPMFKILTWIGVIIMLDMELRNQVNTLEGIIVRHCSPTLAGMKTGNLISCQYESRENLSNHIRKMNKVLVPKGLRIIPLRFSQDKVLLYVFRPSKLNNDLTNDLASSILQQFGYPCEDLEKCILHLIERLNNSSDFPHEIGLFIGYPPEDVREFIKNNGGGECKCVGIWKAYSNEDDARRIFSRYKKCTNIYLQKWSEGRSIQHLAVAF